jgi:Na+/proline symporter
VNLISIKALRRTFPTFSVICIYLLFHPTNRQRRHKTQPNKVSMSLVASYLSGITLLSTPTEIYVHGSQYAYILGGPAIMGIFFHLVMIPVFYELKVVSMYEVSRRRRRTTKKKYNIHLRVEIASRKIIIYTQHAFQNYLIPISLCNRNSFSLSLSHRQYLQRRFDKNIRMFGSFTEIVSTLLYIPICIYVPALAFNVIVS